MSELTGLGFTPVPPGWACASPGTLAPGTIGLANLSFVRTTKIALRAPARRSARTPLPKTSKHASSLQPLLDDDALANITRTTQLPALPRCAALQSRLALAAPAAKTRFTRLSSRNSCSHLRHARPAGPHQACDCWLSPSVVPRHSIGFRLLMPSRVNQLSLLRSVQVCLAFTVRT